MKLRLPVAALLVALAAATARAQTTGSNGIYDVAVNGTGEYTARTGIGHPNPGQNVFYNGAAGFPGTTWNSIRSYDSMREWVLRAGAATPASGYTCRALGTATLTPLVDGAGVQTGVRNTWSVADSQDDLEVVQEVNAEGVAFADSVVRVTVCVTNRARRPASVGIRFQWDWQIGFNDGAYIGIRPPYPPNEPFLGREQDFPAPTFDFYDVSDSQNPSIVPSLYRVGGTVNAPAFSMGPTPPELLQYAAWPLTVQTCFDYRTSGQPVGSIDSCVNYYWGATPATGILLGPDESFCATQYVFVFDEEPPPFCEIFALAAGGTFCQPDPTTVDASASYSPDCAGPLEYRFTDPFGIVVQDWSSLPTCQAFTSGAWTVDVRCSTDTACASYTTMDVREERRPMLYRGDAVDIADCNLGIQVSWDEATWQDPGVSGLYDVRRSEISCADAMTRPPLAAGLTSNRFSDDTTLQGRTYYYYVVAEDGIPAVACTPVGPRGGAIAELCIGPVSDVADPNPPANLCWPLRVSRVGHELTLKYGGGRPLLPTEHVHVLKASDDPAAAFGLVSPEGYLATSWVETDTSSRLQFFDVRFVNACEVMSPDDEPPGRDPPAGVPCP